MEPASRSESSATLVRGCDLTKSLSMSLERDPEFARLQAEKGKLEATRFSTLVFGVQHDSRRNAK